MTYKYDFTESYPPRMKDIKGPPTEIPPSDLMKQIGIATWTRTDVLYGVPDFDVDISGFRRKPITQTTRYNVKRTKVWALSDAPHHYAQNITKKITVVEGYSRTEKVTFARTLDVDVTGKVFGFGTDIKTSLQLTDETEQQWKEERTEETETTFEAEHWYASWTLLDILEGTKHITYDWGLPPINAEASFRVIISLYDDSVKDSDIRFVASDMTIKKLNPLGAL